MLASPLARSLRHALALALLLGHVAGCTTEESPTPQPGTDAGSDTADNDTSSDASDADDTTPEPDAVEDTEEPDGTLEDAADVSAPDTAPDIAEPDVALDTTPDLVEPDVDDGPINYAGEWVGTWRADGVLPLSGDFVLILEDHDGPEIEGEASFTGAPCFSFAFVDAVISDGAFTAELYDEEIAISIEGEITRTRLTGTFLAEDAGFCSGYTGIIEAERVVVR